MGKKKFIDKKRSATFHLLSRDTSADSGATADAGAGSSSPPSDRVFVRVDSNPYSVPDLTPAADSDADSESDSIFADAPDDPDYAPKSPPSLPDNVRKQILELGLSDDGYNYLLHLRGIRNAGGGSAYYHNSKARLDSLPADVKAYDATRVRVEAGEEEEEAMRKVAERTVGVRVQKAADPDLMRLLDDGDLSRFESDVEDLEEDFVLMANRPDGDEDEVEVVEAAGLRGEGELEKESGSVQVDDDDEDHDVGGGEKPRVRRLLDEQFDLLTLREYDNDSDSDDAGYIEKEEEPLAAKLQYVLKDHKMDDLELEDKNSTLELLDVSEDVIRKCKEYAETYYDDNQHDEVVMVQESSDESEVWDCETIVSTYSNLDNHPGKITAPGNPKKKTLIALRGKEKLPVDYLPHSKKSLEDVKTRANSGDEKSKRKPRSEESKEEKKERKAAVKEERKEARQAKKELKVLYRCETQRAQKVVAVAGPSSIHLM